MRKIRQPTDPTDDRAPEAKSDPRALAGAKTIESFVCGTFSFISFECRAGNDQKMAKRHLAPEVVLILTFLQMEMKRVWLAYSLLPPPAGVGAGRDLAKWIFYSVRSLFHYDNGGAAEKSRFMLLFGSALGTKIDYEQ